MAETNKYILDPYLKAKEERDKNSKKIKKTSAERKKERANKLKELRKKVAQNATKSIAPVLGLALTTQAIVIASQAKKLEKLVDSVNAEIAKIQTQKDVIKCRVLRDNALVIIANNEKRVQNIVNTVQRLRSFVSIFNTLINLLSSLPLPTSVPPGIGIPISIIIKVSKALEKAQKIVSALNTLLGILGPIMDSILNKIKEQKSRLNKINDLVDKKSVTPEDIANYINELENNTQPTFDEYKGYKFALKDENNPKFTIRGRGRQYAVAIDSDGNEAFYSEASFTLDPTDLIEQLKIKIDLK